MRRWPAVLSHNCCQVFVTWQQLQGENSSKFSKKKRKKFLIQLKKELAGLPASSSTSTKHVTPQQNKRKGTAIGDQASKNEG